MGGEALEELQNSALIYYFFYLFLDAECKMPRTSTLENLLETGT